MPDDTDENLSWLVYASRAVVPFDEDALAALLAGSRVANRAKGLTGVLLYRDGRFLQALEGPVPELARLFGVIALDPRHTEVQVLLGESIPARRFPSWAMGYRTWSDSPGEWPVRFLRIFDELLDTAPRPKVQRRVHALLDWFADAAAPDESADSVSSDAA